MPGPRTVRATTCVAVMVVAGVGCSGGSETTAPPPPPPATNNASLSFAQCGAGGKPLWVAFQDGDTGAWTRITGTNDVFSFNVTQARGGFAYVTPAQGGTAYLTTVFLGTRADLSRQVTICGASAAPQRTITGTVTGMTPGQAANVYLGGRPGIASPQFPNFTINSVPDGPHDLVVVRSGGVASAQDRVIIRQNQSLTHNTNVGTLDMNGSESFAVATANLVIGNAPASGISAVSIVLLTGTSCDPAAVTGLSGPANSFLIIGVPDQRMRATDMHQVSVLSGGADGTRSTTEVFHTMADRTIALPANITSTVTTVAGHYKRLNATFSLPAEYNQLIGLSMTSTSMVRNAVSVTATAAYAGPNVALAIPNFSGLSGWDDSWAPAANATSNWMLSVSGSTQAAGASMCVAGTRTRTFGRTGQL